MNTGEELLSPEALTTKKVKNTMKKAIMLK